MSQVNVLIYGVILYCDDSILDIELGNEYVLEKRYLDELPFKDRITDGEGKLTINYIGSQLSDEKGKYFICIRKEDTYSVEMPDIKPDMVLTDSDFMCENQINEYKKNQMQYLHKVFSLLHLFKAGNIGFIQLFFEQKFTAMGFITNNVKQTDNSITRNIVDERKFCLDEEEVKKCNSFLKKYDDTVYMTLKDSIDEFIWGLEQIDIPTGFEQYTTALEMTMLAKGQKNKKEALAKRVATMLEGDSTARLILYNKMKDFYRYRSESLHEGNGQNISNTELIELEQVVRRVLVNYLDYCKQEKTNNPATTWDEIKNKKIQEMIAIVQTSIATNELPQ